MSTPLPRGTAPRRAREIALTREHILAAAARTFARLGFNAARMQDIAAEADYSVPSLYVYFRGKNEIFRDLLKCMREDIRASFEEPVISGLSLRQRLEVAVRRQFATAERWRDALTVFFSREVPVRSTKRRGPSGFAESATHFAHVIRECANSTSCEEYDRLPAAYNAEILGFALAGLVQAFKRRWLESEATRPLVDDAPQVVELFLHGACAATSADSAAKNGKGTGGKRQAQKRRAGKA